MKLIGRLYEIIDAEVEASSANYTIKLNSQDIIYKGHFPGYPITPGVIQIKIGEELLGNCLGFKLELFSVQQAKFLNVINPIDNDIVMVEMSYEESSANQYKLKARFVQNGTTVSKIQATFVRLD